MIKKILLTVASCALLTASSLSFAATPTQSGHWLIADLNKMSQSEFEKAIAPVFEKAPWAVKATGERRPYRSFMDMYRAMDVIINSADAQVQLDLINSHPDLACKGVRPANVGEHSQKEQAGSGLNECSPEEAVLLKDLALAYHNKFGFTFFLAAAGFNRVEIAEQLKMRMNNTRDQEFATALQQISKVMLMRMLATAK